MCCNHCITDEKLLTGEKLWSLEPKGPCNHPCFQLQHKVFRLPPKCKIKSENYATTGAPANSLSDKLVVAGVAVLGSSTIFTYVHIL